MRLARAIAVTSLAIVTFGSVLVTGGYAWYLRSAAYRSSCAAVLSERLGGLAAEIGQVVPRSLHAREFRAIRIWLPHRRGEAAFIDTAVLTQTPTPQLPEAFALDLNGGRCEISTRTWLRDDYRTLLESGLRPGFAPDGPHRVTFRGLDLAFEHGHFRAALNDAAGVVSFEQPNVGRANLTCGDLNGFQPAQRVSLYAQFSPTTPGVRLDQVQLLVPELPIRVLGLSDLTGLGLRSGSFSGRLQYRETELGRELTVSGKIFAVPLAECTAALFEHPWSGTADELELENLTLLNGRPTRAVFHGVVKDATLGDMLAPWGLADIGGRLVLQVHTAELSLAGIDTFVASGRCAELSLERVSAALGWGSMSGRARVTINDLTIRDNCLSALDARIQVDRATHTPNWVERALLSQILRRTIGVSLPSFLPNRFEYAQLGLRLDVRDETLWVFGTHGPREKAILSVSIADEELPVVFEPEQPFDLHPLFDEWRAQLTARLSEHLQTFAPHLWPSWRPGPATRPKPE